MRKILMLAAAMVAMTTTAFAHDVKDNPLRGAHDTTIGSSTNALPGAPGSEAAAAGTLTEGLPADQITARRNVLYTGTPNTDLAAGHSQPVNGGPMGGGHGVWSLPSDNLAAKP